MAAISSKGTRIAITSGSVAGNPVTLAGATITSANPAVMTLAAPMASASTGDVITFGSSTGYNELNGKSFVVSAVNGADVTLQGADLTGTQGTAFAAGATATLYDDTSLINLCLSSFDIAAGTANQIDTSTFCGVSSILGNTSPGTITLNGYVDPNDTGFKELIAASTDNKPRTLVITLPGASGYLIGVIAVGEIQWSVPLEGAVGFSVQASQNVAIKYVAP